MDSAVSKVVDAGLSSLLQAMIDTLTPSTFLQSIGFIFGVEGEAKKLSSTLSRIQDILGDAEDRHIKDKVLCRWLSDLKDVAYEAEDILDELEAMVLRAKQEAPMQTRKRKLLSEVFSRPVSNLTMGTRIKEIRERLEKIEREGIDCLHLTCILKSERLIPGKRPPTGSIVDETIVLGRENDREKMVGLLTSDDDSPASDSSVLKVVPICGMGGLGKTTLAQSIYNDEQVTKHFNLRLWLYVSEDFDLIRMARAIAEKVSGSGNNAPHLTDFDAIQVCIQNALQGRRFLLVLDDVWNDNCNDWDALLAPLRVGARGSTILVTTRSQTVSSILGTVPTHSLQGLPYDDCWSLFKRRAFVEGNSDAHPDLVEVGEKIVKKCNGLPLAVKTLGGMLRSKVDVVEWEAILKSEIWELPEEKNDILPALRLNYHHLPAHLKRCFAYCGCIVGKGWNGADRDLIVLMWMAQGFIQSKGSRQMEDIGREYLVDLVSRSLLNCGEHSSYPYMHDLTNDLACSILGNDFLEIGDGKPDKNVEKVRHLTCKLHNISTESFNFKDLYCYKNLRTFWLQSSGWSSKLDPIITIPADFFIYLRHLCILDLQNILITELPESIGNLVQLRYLNLSCTIIERLPKSTTKLYHLQTLMLDFCLMLVELPNDLSNLVNLRYLSLEDCSVSIVPRIGRLTSLQKLQKFTVGKEIGYRINELKDMIHIQGVEGVFHISNLENVVSVEEAKQAELKNKLKIDELKLEWNSNSVRLRQQGIEEEVLNALQPQTNIKALCIIGYCGVRFPTWLVDSSFSKLTRVTLKACRCHHLPPFGQLPSLTHLSLVQIYELNKLGREFYGDGSIKGFPSLKQLDLYSMPDLEEWSVGDFSLLGVINISNCIKLRALPLSLRRVSMFCYLYLSACDDQILSSLQYLTSLSFLEVHNFPNLTSPLHGLQCLTSLHSLIISTCPRLTSLYDAVLPATRHRLQNSNCSNPTCFPEGLKRLRLLFCPEIHSLPEQLPTTLQSIFIEGCPLLKEKYQEGGEYRCKISHIPEINIF